MALKNGSFPIKYRPDESLNIFDKFLLNYDLMAEIKWGKKHKTVQVRNLNEQPIETVYIAKPLPCTHFKYLKYLLQTF